jgi:hypothetical protein
MSADPFVYFEKLRYRLPEKYVVLSAKSLYKDAVRLLPFVI